MMRRLYATAAMILAAASLGFAQAKPGPLPDRIIFDTRMQEDIGLRDAAEGKTDFFFQNITGPTLKALPAEVRAKLDSYAVPESSWSLQLNPYPNKAPYQGKVEGKAVFNPFAVREIRYAVNWLVDRKRIVDEVLDGEGGPMFTPMTPGQPGTYKFNLVASKLGMTARGNEKKAIAEIEAAMKAAAELPENRGKLAKNGQFWTFEGQPVTIRFMIRVDDPNGRLRVGRYIADQLEKAGIKVERLEWDRAKCFDFLDDDPAKLGWSMYTEGWGAGATRAYWDISVSQMYAPYYGQLPGGNREGFWSFEHKEIDDLAQKCINGQFLDAAEYWKDNLRAVELGLKDSVRINLTYSLSYFTVNKARFNARFPYGLGDGPNRWSTIGADVKPDAKGERTLRTTLFSARGALFMSAWDPVGPGGFSDTYIRAIVDPVTDPANFEAPNSALDTPL
ncbi:MAG: ABC transporter substrate-binding protein, partial [Spirochaetaceae bacterium]|nr:ABC transporter substrate-binding protein [Spirochaetaceae bacterium]